jgi:hypothetical protein
VGIAHTSTFARFSLRIVMSGISTVMLMISAASVIEALYEVRQKRSPAVIMAIA